WENFANNLGTDLAPLLALFGEQVTKQFMSESTSGLDSILFGLAPLGVITAIISAIRVSGSPRLRALVGRAKESRGQVEADLMSSTSPDVCELWNGDGVVRVLGQPVLLQIIRAREENGACKLYTFQEAYNRIFGSIGNDNYPVQNLEQNPPNLSLNVNMAPLPPFVSVLLILIGVLLQGGVLIYAAVSQYHLKQSKYDDDAIIVYGFPLLATGTTFLAIGMYFCAEVVQTSTKEHTWNFRQRGFHCEGIIWLQQGGQTVGDQRFGSFARHMDSKHEIRTSVKCEKLRTTQIVLVSVGLTLVGFVSQFVALRAMHATVTVVQLGAILIMTAIRSCAYIRRNDKNDIPDPLQVEGHELEWLAKELHGCAVWEVQLGPDFIGEAGDRSVPNSPPMMPDSLQMTPIELDLGPVFNSEEVLTPGSPSLVSHSLPSISALLHAVHNPPSDTAPAIPDLIDKNEEDDSRSLGAVGRQYPDNLENLAIEVMQTRARLAELSQDWVLQLRKTVKSLQTTLDQTMNEIYTSITLKEDWKSRETFSWFLPVWAEQKGPLTNRNSHGPGMFVELTMTRGLDQNDHWRPWVSDPCELEAILSLWVSSAKEKRMHSNGSVSGSVGQAGGCFWYLGVESAKAIRDYNLWIHRETDLHKKRLSDAHMYFGSVDPLPVDRDARCLIVKSFNTLEILCAQHIYSAFMSELAPEIVSIGGTTERRRTEITASEGNLPTWMHFRLNNTKLVRLAGIFFEAGLGTIEEAYFCFFPFLSREEIVPPAKEAFREASQAAKRCQSSGNWDQALSIDEWMSDNREATGFDELGLAIWYSEIDERVLVLLGFIDSCIAKAVKAAPISPYGRSALQAASGNGHRELVEYLLTCASPWSDVNCPAAVPFGCTALQAASQGGHADVVKLLLANGASVDVVPAPNLDHCVEFRRWLNMDISVEVTAHGYQYIPAHRLHQTRVGVSALCAAATNGHEKVVQILLRAQAEVNMMNHGTALQAAAAAGHLRVVKKLRRRGANLNAAADACGGATALQAAVGEGHFYVARYMLDFGADVDAPPAAYQGRSALAAAAGRGDTFMLDYLIYKGADVNQAPGTCFGATALQVAARIGHPQIVSTLLKSGADINGPTATIGGITALAAAAAAGHLDIVKLLLNHPEPGDVNAAAPYGGRTALQAAAEGGYVKVVELLLLKGADADDVPAPGGGKTALVAALEGGHVEVVKMLIGASANVNGELVDDFGHSAIEEAVGEGMLDVVEEWLATFKPLKRRGVMPLAVAVQNGNLDMVDMLLNAGAKATMEEGEESQLMRQAYGLDEDQVETMNRILGKPRYSDTIEKSASERLLFGRKVATLLKMKSLLQNIKLDARELPIHLAERLGYADIAKRLKLMPEEEMARKQWPETVENGDSNDERSMIYL
ncbi:hypothetical protein DFP73DRAFT_479516, partial [Morchella snyderi]